MPDLFLLIIPVAYAIVADRVLRRRGPRSLWIMGAGLSGLAWGLGLVLPSLTMDRDHRASTRIAPLFLAFAVLGVTLTTQILSSRRIPTVVRAAASAIVGLLLMLAGVWVT